MDTKSFSTRTERRLKENPHVKGTHILGLDMGYSGPKCFHEKGNLMFPNYCQELQGELFGELSKTDIVYEDSGTKKKYCVGDMANRLLTEDSVVPEDTLFGRNHYLHPNFLITFRTALGLAMWDTPTDGSDIFIQTGLPPAYFKKDQEYLKRVMTGTHRFSIQNGNEKREFDITIQPEQIDVMYQPMGTYWSTMFNVDGNLLDSIFDFQTSNFMIFDGGFGTLDKFLVQGNTLKTKGTDANLGMRRVLDETRKIMEEELQVQVSIPAMQSCLKTGQIKINDMINLRVNTYPIDEFLEKANQMVCEEAFESIKDEVFGIRYLVMTGGTGAAWYPYFKKKLKDIALEVIPGNINSPLPVVYSNARGYYMYRLQQIKMKR